MVLPTELEGRYERFLEAVKREQNTLHLQLPVRNRVYYRRLAPWSSGLGRLVFSQEDGGSNPPGVTIFISRPALFCPATCE